MSPSPAFPIRQSGPGDLPLMEALLTMSGKAFDEAESYGAARPGRGYLRQLLGSRSFLALAAMKGPSVVGGLAACEFQKFEQERSEFYIYDLAVAGGHRRQGIATGLIRELQQIGGARGTHAIPVQADWGDGPAVEIGSRLGAREDVHRFDVDGGEESP